MAALLVFAVTLVLAVLVSDLAARSILSTAVIFLVAGFVSGVGGAGWIRLDPNSHQITDFFSVALCIVLFTDGMHVSQRDLHQVWRLASRTLLVGMPLTMGLTAMFCRWLTHLTWTQSFLVGAALSPTDPIFAAAIVGREEVSVRVRRLLNVESGLNDGLALPAVMLLLGALGVQAPTLGKDIEELLVGTFVGVAVPWIVIAALESRYFAAVGVYERLGATAIGLVVFALAGNLRANQFLAMFVAGITISIKSSNMQAAFAEFGETLSELAKLAAVLIFGSFFSFELFRSVPLQTYLFVALVLFIVRPFALAPALAGHRLSPREWYAIVWFGPKGFASLLFAFLILNSGIRDSRVISGLIGLVVVASILAHSSTDVLIARSFTSHKQGLRAS